MAQPIAAKTLATLHPAPVAATPVLSDFQSISVDCIVPSRFQPRKSIDDAALARLADSIKRSGLMQPVIVRLIESSGGGLRKYELVAGERRWRAAQAAGLTHVPALVRELPDEDAAEWALVENVQREDLNPMERAWALKALGERFKLQQGELAERIGLERSTVANLIRLTELEPEIAAMLARSELSAGHGKALLAAPPGEARIRLAGQAAAQGMTVRALEQAAAQLGGKPRKQGAVAAGGGSAERLAALRDLERQIGQQLGTKVQISTDRRGTRGRLAIEFYGLDHFDGLLARLNVRTQ